MNDQYSEKPMVSPPVCPECGEKAPSVVAAACWLCGAQFGSTSSASPPARRSVGDILLRTLLTFFYFVGAMAASFIAFFITCLASVNNRHEMFLAPNGFSGSAC